MWDAPPLNIRSSYRSHAGEIDRSQSYGFRVAHEIQFVAKRHHFTIFSDTSDQRLKINISHTVRFLIHDRISDYPKICTLNMLSGQIIE